MSQLALRQRSDQNKKVEDKRKELQEFVERFSANASKSRQATSRKRLLKKLVVDEIPPSTRKYPAIIFKAERDCGDQLLKVEGLKKVSDEGQLLFSDITFSIDKQDKIAVISRDRRAVTAFFEILTNNETATEGTFEWGTTPFLSSE